MEKRSGGRGVVERRCVRVWPCMSCVGSQAVGGRKDASRCCPARGAPRGQGASRHRRDGAKC